jgi:hypothetical protein
MFFLQTVITKAFFIKNLPVSALINQEHAFLVRSFYVLPLISGCRGLSRSVLGFFLVSGVI